MAAALLVGATGVLKAGTYSNNFNDFDPFAVPGAAVYGGALNYDHSSGGVNDSGVLKLTTNIGDQQSSFIIEDLDDGNVVGGFTATFMLRIGGGTARPADGFSFNWAPDLPDAPFGEEGAGTGITISFDTWDNAGDDTAPAIDIKVGGVIIETAFMSGQREGGRARPAPIFQHPETGEDFDMRTGDAFEPVRVEVSPSGTLTLEYKGVIIFDNVYLEGFEPFAFGRFGMGARTGGANDNHFVDDLTITTVPPATGPVTIARHPESATVNEFDSVTFSVVPDGPPPIQFEWFRDGVEVGGATGASYTIPSASAADSGAEFTVRATNPEGSATSDPATLTVIPDTEPLTLARVSGSVTLNQVVVVFNKAVDEATATTLGNYSISPALTISAASLVAPDRVILSTPAQPENTEYTLTVSNVQDRAATPNVIAANTTAQFRSFMFVVGFAQAEYYTDIGGVSIENNLRPAAKFPDAPDFVEFFTSMEIPVNRMDNYGVRLATWFTPPATGNYVFFISSDDNGQLWLSTDSDPANIHLIAVEPEWNASRAWITSERRPNLENRSDWYLETQWPDGWTITLNAGQRYYMEALVKEGGGGDNLAVTFIRDSDQDPEPASAPALTGDVIGMYMDPGAIPPAYQSHTPTTEQFVPLGGSVTLTMALSDAGGAAEVFWQYNDQDFPGAEGASYTIQNFGPQHVGLWNGVARNAGGSASTPNIYLSPELEEGTLFIEAEDFNFGRGNWIQDQPIGMTGPYPGGAYQDLGDGLDGSAGDGSDFGVDYFDSTPGNEAAVYRPGTAVAAGKFGDTATPPAAGLNRGTFQVEVNHVVGWTAAGEWMNYTRLWPDVDQDYWAFARISSGGAAPAARLDEVTSGASTTEQTVEKLGEFGMKATADWDIFTFAPLRDDAGNVQRVRLRGERTVRYTWLPGAGDVDYLAFIPAGEGPPPGDLRFTAARLQAGNVVIEWEGQGTLESAGEVTGPWTSVAGSSPHTVTPDGMRRFFRLRE